MNLAIEGHSTQGSEVIARLKMLGGMNTFNLNGSETNCYYYIDNNNRIYHCLGIDPRNYIYYTLEEFLEKFPYKVGDKVQHKGATSCGSIFEVEEMRWEENTVKYTLCLFGCNYKRSTLPAEYLQPYKEETMEEKLEQITFDIPDGYEFFGINDDNQVVLAKKQPQYPKTYEECAKELGYNQVMPKDHILGYKGSLLSFFQQLLICRDAYWKIAGDWKPDWTKADERKYCIVNTEGNITKWVQKTTNKIFAFPTEEMRDAFYENFKDLIEQCKELL